MSTSGTSTEGICTGSMGLVTPCCQSRLYAALCAGAVAIAFNTAALAAADLVPLATAHGGLLRLLARSLAITPPSSAAFQICFHAATGLVMAVFYAYALEPVLRGSAWRRGLTYAAAAWVINAAIVLPLLGEGFAGTRSTPATGIAWFAAAHTLFFVAQAVLYDRLYRRSDEFR